MTAKSAVQRSSTSDAGRAGFWRRHPVETGLPMDPRTGDYVRRRGRSYRRAEVGPGWVLERFPAELG